MRAYIIGAVIVIGFILGLVNPDFSVACNFQESLKEAKQQIQSLKKQKCKKWTIHAQGFAIVCYGKEEATYLYTWDGEVCELSNWDDSCRTVIKN